MIISLAFVRVVRGGKRGGGGGRVGGHVMLVSISHPTSLASLSLVAS